MSFFGASKMKSGLVWNQLISVEQLGELEKTSFETPVLLLKHSTRCSISAMAKNRLELYWNNEIALMPYYLDLLSYRAISDEISKRYSIRHESPQVILLKNGAAVYHASHSEIDYNTIKNFL